jgi:outer membrane protein OmpA-like peptidoglycan-associated protein
MKSKLKLIILVMIALSVCTPSQAQIENPFKKVKKRAEKETNKKIDEEIDKAFDPKAEEDKKKENKPEDKQENKKEDVTAVEELSQEEADKNKPAKLEWAKYDFIPGEEVFFEDNQEGEENGEFPSRWDIYSGNVENARVGGENVIMFRENSWIMPYLENAESPYLPDVFTLEFDCYFHEGENYQNFNIAFYDKLNQKSVDLPEIKVYWNKCESGRFSGWYPGAEQSSFSKMEGWRHVSISFNKRALKVYLDDTRLLNIPNLKVKPTGISLWGEYQRNKGKSGYIKNIRLAKGGVKLYDKMMQDGKIIATGIRFDIGKTSLKPESMGIINSIAEMMNEHPELKISVEGHTDSDGDLETNQKLSEGRAETVKKKLVAMGISADRLTTKGYGESNPIATNNTVEGKANNRRVEFVKI